ncbi:MAG: type II toxin-antitoxin system Phd/YefM family antitoxin [bacterium]|nr:type II toxin-antitoxin system Phd/YefM family antitoxin [bacterium]
MPVTRTIAELGHNAQEIARLCQESGEPVRITDDGDQDLVVMSLETYERGQARLELYRLLDEAEADFQNGDRGVSVASIRQRLRQ